ncbi:MAG: putative ATPase [Myxococcota bacterium]|jgi:predicted ATPase
MFLERIQTVGTRIGDREEYPWSLPLACDLDLRFERPITFFVGENGSGKSTVLEAIAAACGLPVAGGGAQELADRRGQTSALGEAVRPTWGLKRPRDRYFFKAQTLHGFSELLDERARDPDFEDDPYAAYGGATLTTRSHGEAFLEVISGRLGTGLYLFDEPEAALSPQRQLSLLLLLDQMAKGGAQCIIATHAPIVLTMPNSTILTFDSESIVPTAFEDLDHVTITRRMLLNPEDFWRRQAAQPEEDY